MSSSQSTHSTRLEAVLPDSAWRENFETESKRIASMMGASIIAIHHIRSTAISGIYAKPVIDFLIKLRNILKPIAKRGNDGTLTTSLATPDTSISATA